MDNAYRELLKPKDTFFDFLPGLLVIGILAYLWMIAKPDDE